METILGIIVIFGLIFVFAYGSEFIDSKTNHSEKSIVKKYQEIINYFLQKVPLKYVSTSPWGYDMEMKYKDHKLKIKNFSNHYTIDYEYIHKYSSYKSLKQYYWEFPIYMKKKDVIEKIDYDLKSHTNNTIPFKVLETIIAQTESGFIKIDKYNGFQECNIYRGFSLYRYSLGNEFHSFNVQIKPKPDCYSIIFYILKYNKTTHLKEFEFKYDINEIKNNVNSVHDYIKTILKDYI